MKLGVQTHQWGYFRVGDQVMIATCIATSYFEAVAYFEEIGLMEDPMYYIKIVNLQS
jgi:hypothetical protein